MDTNTFYPKEISKKDSCTNVLFVGRLEYRKGLNQLIAFANYIENIENMRLLIATNTEENTELFSKLTHTKIKCAISKEKMNDFYNSGDVMFFPSLFESFGLVTIEALSAGIPVMGNQVGVISDLYMRKHAGVSVISDNINENVASLFKLAEEYRDFEARQKLHQSMVLHYSLESYKEKLEKLWD